MDTCRPCYASDLPLCAREADSVNTLTLSQSETMPATSAALRPLLSTAALQDPQGPHFAELVTENSPSVVVPLATARCITPQSALTKASMFDITEARRRKSRL